jgi:hypothetical protein
MSVLVILGMALVLCELIAGITMKGCEVDCIVKDWLSKVMSAFYILFSMHVFHIQT